VGSGKFPVFVGEWSIQTEFDNKLGSRGKLFEAGRWAFQAFVQGSAFWTGKMFGNGEVQVHGEGDQKGHWDFMGLIDDGLVQPFDPSYVP
jgi:hypothetical protein